MRKSRRKSSPVRLIVLAICLLFEISARCSLAENVTGAADEVSAPSAPVIAAAAGADNDTADIMQGLQDMMASLFASVPPSLTLKLIGANIRPQCSLALLRTVDAFKKLEPWALRLFDATGKYPTGVLQASRVDLGAFDECLETEVRDSSGNVSSRGQYCNLQLQPKKDVLGPKEMEFLSAMVHPKIIDYMGLVTEAETPFIRIGICFLDDCNESDLQALADTVQPPTAKIRVSNCVTAEPEPWSSIQIGIVAFLAVLGVIIAGATIVDLTMGSKPKYAEKGGVLLKVVLAFSAAASTRELFHVAERTNADHYSLRFLYGMRTISLGHIVLGHCCQVVSDTWARMLNLIISTRLGNLILPAAYNSVDTFFFLSGFLLCLAVTKQKRNRTLVFIIAVCRRLIRTGVPIFFVITCIFVLPRFVTGPDAKTFFQKFYDEMGENWWHLIIPIRNFFDMTERSVMIHLWYVSADFQLFVVSLLVLQLLKSQKRLAMGAFIGLSLLGCAIALWTATNPDVLPFITYPAFTITAMLETMNKYYMRPFYHAVCFFSGCMTLLILDNFKNLKISKTANAVGWFVATSCAICVVLMKAPWYKRQDPTSEAVKLLVAFFDRVLWSIFLSWFTLACATGRGGFVARVLSSDVFVPLGKLSFGVYLIHYPFLMVMLHTTRERLLWSHFNVVTLFFGVLVWSNILAYMAFLACEGPTAAVDKLIFKRLMRRGRPTKPEPQPDASDAANGQKLGAHRVPPLWSKL
ncbi:nose resistant to fluoxetine protein 6-like [Dermacentor silvarum]|uniref:nose resistant to fluoxetine protein 6-like n=1 Tax=Dermacentor silvarum TaxID=543639 RepID=UPI002100B07E|nr:nose resistant to fluoxetine protein 6-like [Dermacentor silvarum]